MAVATTAIAATAAPTTSTTVSVATAVAVVEAVVSQVAAGWLRAVLDGSHSPPATDAHVHWDPEAPDPAAAYVPF